MQHARYRSTGTDRTRHKVCAEMEPLPGMLYILYTIYDQSQTFFVFRYFLENSNTRQNDGHLLNSACTNFPTSVFAEATVNLFS